MRRGEAFIHPGTQARSCPRPANAPTNARANRVLCANTVKNTGLFPSTAYRLELVQFQPWLVGATTNTLLLASEHPRSQTSASMAAAVSPAGLLQQAQGELATEEARLEEVRMRRVQYMEHADRLGYTRLKQDELTARVRELKGRVVQLRDRLSPEGVPPAESEPEAGVGLMAVRAHGRRTVTGN
jgi:hypothetical protein